MLDTTWWSLGTRLAFGQTSRRSILHSVVRQSSFLQTGKALAVGIESLTLEGGGTIEDLDIDFTLPGYPELELKV